jgi:sortase family protein
VNKPSLSRPAKSLRKPAWALVAVAAVVVGVVVGLVISHGKSGGSPYDQAPAAVPAAASKAPSSTAGQGFRVMVPSIGADAPVVPEGATGPNGGSLTIPDSVREVGWWDGVWQSPAGPVHEKVAAPGQSGVALLAGHIDSATQGQGALYRLAQAKPGAAVTVVGKDGKVTHWKVTHVQTVLKSALPAALFVDTGSPQLALVSCGGPFDAATGHYLDNVIAWAVPA